MYYNDNKAYPSGNSDGQIIKGATVFAWGTQWLDTVVYMEKLPSDSRGKYFYESQSVAPGTNNGYRLYARLENAEDQKAARVPITLVAGKYLPATILCGTGKGCNYVIMSTNVSAPAIVADSP
jgi:hypothetical protein